MKFVSILVLFILATKAEAQISEVNPFFDEKSKRVDLHPVQLTNLGRYYYSNSWNAGNIYFKKNQIIRGYYMKYDLLKGQIEVIINKEIVGFHHSQIDSLEWFNANTIKAVRFIHRSHLTNNKDFSHFMEVAEDGEIRLLVSKKVVALQKGSAPSLVNDTSGDTQIIEQFFFERDRKIEEVKNSRNKNLNFFNSSDLEDFVRSNSLGWKRLSDLKKIVSFYNSMN